MDEHTIPELPEATGPSRPQRRGRTLLVIGATIALLLVTATAVTAATGWRFYRLHNSAATGQEQAPPQGQAGGRQRGSLPGLEGVVTAVDESSKTLTIAGVPGVTTVAIDANVKLTTVKPDGTTQNVALGDFRVGQVVRVHGTIDRSQFQPGQRPDPTKIKLTVTEIVLPASGVVNGTGIVTAVSGTTITVVSMGNFSLTITPASGATMKKMDGSTFAVSDIKVGDRLMFQGTQSGNAVSASNLRLVPQGSFGAGGFGPGGPGGPNQPRGPGRPGKPGGTSPSGTPKPPSA